METIFEVRDRVFDIEHGWGTIIEIDNSLNSPIVISFDKHKNEDTLLCYNLDGSYGKNSTFKRLSFSQYLLERFTQKRLIDYSEYIGKWGKFWDNGENTVIVGKLYGYYQYQIHHFKVRTHDDEVAFYTNFEPLTDEQLKVLNLE